MANPHFYRARTVWTGGENGPAKSYDSYSRDFRIEMKGRPSIDGSADVCYRGDPNRVNPEELLVASISSCHMLTFIALAVRNRMDVVSYEDDAEGVMQLVDGVMRVTDVVLRPSVVLGSGADLDKAVELHEQAEKQCFIANSVSCDIRVEPLMKLA